MKCYYDLILLKEGEMKRTKTLIAGILGIIMSFIIVFIWGNLLVSLFSIISGGNVSVNALAGFLIFAYFVIEICAICSLIFSIFTVIYWNSKPEIYEKKKKLIITAIVFNFIGVLFFLISIFLNATPASIAISIIAILIYVAANVLYILDMKKEKPAKVVEEPTSVESDKPQNEENKENK